MTQSAQVTELDGSAVATPATAGQVSELDVGVVSTPPTSAQVSELDVAVVAQPATGTQISETDVAVVAYLAPCTTMRARLWKITRTDGAVFAFTSHDEDVSYLGVTYKMCASLQQGAISATSEIGQSGDTELNGLLTDDSITEADLYGGLFNDADVEIWEVDWGDGDDTPVPFCLGAGNLGVVTRMESSYRAEVLGPAARLQQTAIVFPYTPGCLREFGNPDTGCPVDTQALALRGCNVVSNRGRDILFFTPGLPAGSSIWNGGTIVFTYGRNAGVKLQVNTTDLASGAMSLWDLMPFQPDVGDSFDLFPGCPHTEAACKQYGVYIDFGGFKDVPGPDALQSNADSLYTG